MKGRELQLRDLPLELILQVLPFEECLLNQQSDVSIPWLNYMDYKRCYRLLGESGIGNARCEHKFDLEMKYGKLIYINFGKFIDAKYLKKYIIFDANAINDIIFDYPDLVRCLKVWTGNLDHDTYLWLDFVNIQSCSSKQLHDVMFTDSTQIEPDAALGLDCLVTRSCCGSDIKSVLLISNLRYEFLRNLKHVEMDMALESFTVLRKKLNESMTECHKIAPKSLHIYLKLEKDQAHPQIFPIEWITSIFNLQSVEEFSLHYYKKCTSLAYMSDWIEKMPHLKSLNLGFGKLNFAQIPRQLEDAHHNSKTNIQVKVDKKYFNSIQHKYNRCYWQERKFRDCVIVCRTGH